MVTSLARTSLSTSSSRYTRGSRNTKRKKRKRMLEKDVESYLTKRVKEINGLSYKWLSTITGVPDRLVIYNGRIYPVEVKTPKGVVSDRQAIVFNEMALRGVPVVVVRSKSDVEALIEAIKP